jgi:hypothetical protein
MPRKVQIVLLATVVSLCFTYVLGTVVGMTLLFMGAHMSAVKIGIGLSPIGGFVLGCLAIAAHLHRQEVRARRANGLCIQCGYDLRGTPERCPECGTPVVVKGESP